MTEINIDAGDYITWRTWCGDTTAYVVLAARDGHVILRSADGFEEGHERIPRGARRATADEAAAFERHRDGRIAPPAYE